MDCVYLRQRMNCLLVCDDESWDLGGDEEEEVVEEYDEGANDGKRGRDLEQEDEVADYIDSDNENEVVEKNGSNENRKGSSSEETASDSEEEGDDSGDEESTSEEEAPTPPASRKKRQKK